jgi:hypothetical protein
MFVLHIPDLPGWCQAGNFAVVCDSLATCSWLQRDAKDAQDRHAQDT